MTTTSYDASTPLDVIDAAVPLAPTQPTRMLRLQRDKVVAATQGSYDAMFSPTVEGLSVAETASLTGMSESAVKVGIHRGLKALAARLRSKTP